MGIRALAGTRGIGGRTTRAPDRQEALGEENKAGLKSSRKVAMEKGYEIFACLIRTERGAERRIKPRNERGCWLVCVRVCAIRRGHLKHVIVAGCVGNEGTTRVHIAIGEGIGQKDFFGNRERGTLGI